jgi:hypothetical protein
VTVAGQNINVLSATTKLRRQTARVQRRGTPNPSGAAEHHTGVLNAAPGTPGDPSPAARALEYPRPSSGSLASGVGNDRPLRRRLRKSRSRSLQLGEQRPAGDRAGAPFRSVFRRIALHATLEERRARCRRTHCCSAKPQLSGRLNGFARTYTGPRQVAEGRGHLRGWRKARPGQYKYRGPDRDCGVPGAGRLCLTPGRAPAGETRRSGSPRRGIWRPTGGVQQPCALDAATAQIRSHGRQLARSTWASVQGFPSAITLNRHHVTGSFEGAT